MSSPRRGRPPITRVMSAEDIPFSSRDSYARYIAKLVGQTYLKCPVCLERYATGSRHECAPVAALGVKP